MVHLDAEERRLRMFVNKDEAKEIMRLIQVINPSENAHAMDFPLKQKRWCACSAGRE